MEREEVRREEVRREEVVRRLTGSRLVPDWFLRCVFDLVLNVRGSSSSTISSSPSAHPDSEDLHENTLMKKQSGKLLQSANWYLTGALCWESCGI